MDSHSRLTAMGEDNSKGSLEQSASQKTRQRGQERESPEYRSWVMSRVRSKDTSPELRVRSLIHRAGYRYRLHVRKLPGSPDMVMRKYRTVVFVNGCFWHRHPGCKQASTPKTNVDYWQGKFERNVARAEKNHAALRRDGWKVVIIWECQTRPTQELSELLTEVLPPQI